MINVIGLGYIGLPTALMLAACGEEVIGTDIRRDVIDTLNEGRLTFTEEGLGQVFTDALKNGICFTTEYACADTYVVSVQTPYDRQSKKIDPSFVIGAVEKILTVCKRGATIIIESTVSPGTVDRHIRPLVEGHGFTVGKDIHLAHAPERIIPGNMLKELIGNSRTVGADDEATAKRVAALYSRFSKGEIVLTDIKTAEMTKVVENTYRAVNIAFANELLMLCRESQLDVHEIIDICNRHPRVSILSPGPGVGGHCIGVDPWFLVGEHPDTASLITAAMEVNSSMPNYVLSRIRDITSELGIKDEGRVGLYGLTYKENVDDTRESPTLQLLDAARQFGGEGRFLAYDPYIKRKIVKNQCFSLDEFLNSVDLVVVMVAHDEIKLAETRLADKAVLDTRHAFDKGTYYRL